MDIGGRSGEMAVFAMVAEQGSLSGAARVLGLTPSSISRIITRIEGRIGTRLLLRTTRAITLTAEGEAYLRGARRILADMAEVEDAITDQGAPRGRLRVSAALAHGRLSIVPLVAAFSARYPAIVVELRLEDEVVDILGGQADVAIRFGQLADSPLTARLIGSIGEVIVASPDYLARHGTPQVPQDLLNHNCLRFNFRRAAPDWPFRVDGRDFSLQVSGTIEGNSGEVLSQLAKLGAGIARIGAFSVADDLASGDLVPLLEAYNPGDQEPIHAVFVGGAAMPARVRAFVDFLVEHHPA
ncbi:MULTISPECIES: LysR family transcriptional regulator [Pseudomonas]|uniref:LysR family transcriptional regulator n=1 Tax=Pseudomonas TaxID=286 RepID=UPI0003CCC0A2|nr:MULTISPECIES: LysR family transcriptional regulator [Pseudomonas]MBT1265998.1 LysR family transcriptional regulator [Pseudomonas sp. VS38]MDP9028974.1 LysR family transcriptional regulator [Pseudomonadota bacterium]NVZ13686.1 LysR family transcriptional regulator [Pseudomonas sp. IPO3775]NWA77665.1 LysR family transcriptional regulator [Pseudomonas sp. C8002]NWA88993.1 LysR family transcriptional regulator [Pseudomonas sp. D8002]NWB23260.1 LysR family transcriptional regulator [Pseudomonas